MAITIKNAVMISIVLIVVAITVPLGLAYLAGAGDMVISVGGVNKTLSEWIDPSVLTLLTILIPILAVIGIAMTFISAVK